MEIKEILKLAESHNLLLKEEMSFNEMGIDFKVGFATDINNNQWVLRIPRRKDLAEQIEKENTILLLAKRHLSVSVPDWRITAPSLIAYPLLENKPVITFDPHSYEVSWNIDKDNPKFLPSLATVLVDLHQIPAGEATNLGIKTLSPDTVRTEVSERVQTVKQELGISQVLERRWQSWLDNDKLWPNFTTFIHGDLYAGHILSTQDAEITGIIDWSEGQVSDPSVDFSGHIAVFGEHSLHQLIKEYEKSGGRVWKYMFEQVVERHAATPLAYGIFALKAGNKEHIQAAKAQLGVN